MALIDKFLFGWGHLEPILLGCISRGHGVLLLGSHGTGKSSFARYVSTAVSNGSNLKFQKYNCDKENLLSMVGCPSPEALKQGRIEYAVHDRSIFNADIILLDEITRAPRETQNMILEALEERTMFGIPLKYKFAIATANEESYKGTYKLDAALLDRFFGVIPVPTTESKEYMLGTEEITKMLGLNQGKREEDQEESEKQLSKAVHKINKTYGELWANPKLRENVNEFTAKFFASILVGVREHNTGATKDSAIRISFRQISSQFVPLLVAVSSYYKAIKESANFLQDGAWDTIRYSIGTKLGFPTEKLKPIFDNLKDLLSDGDTLITRINVAVSTGSVQDRIAALEKYAKKFAEMFEQATKVTIIGNIVNLIDQEKEMVELIKLSKIVEEHQMNEQCEYNIKLKLAQRAIKNGALSVVSNMFYRTNEN